MKSGFVTLIGRSNVGKSTLINALVGTKVAIVTSKPQTTRYPVRGIFHDPRGQIVFVDTPGIFLKQDPLSRQLNRLVREQLQGIDAIVYVVDPTRAQGPEEKQIQQILRQTNVPFLLAINKSDLPENERPFLASARALRINQYQTIECSGDRRRHLQTLIDALFALLPEGEPFYPVGQLTDLERHTWIAEVIREKAFHRLRQELPYSLYVEVIEDALDARTKKRRITAMIRTSELRYKKMIIGKNGETIKRIGMDARKELEAATNESIYLDLTVAVDTDWQTRFTL